MGSHRYSGLFALVFTLVTLCGWSSTALAVANGEACVEDSDCDSNTCVFENDVGICCDRLCDGNCNTCHDNNSPGQCIKQDNDCSGNCGIDSCEPNGAGQSYTGFTCQGDIALCVNSDCAACTADNIEQTVFTCKGSVALCGTNPSTDTDTECAVCNRSNNGKTWTCAADEGLCGNCGTCSGADTYDCQENSAACSGTCLDAVDACQPSGIEWNCVSDETLCAGDCDRCVSNNPGTTFNCARAAAGNDACPGNCHICGKVNNNDWSCKTSNCGGECGDCQKTATGSGTPDTWECIAEDDLCGVAGERACGDGTCNPTATNGGGTNFDCASDDTKCVGCGQCESSTVGPETIYSCEVPNLAKQACPGNCDICEYTSDDAGNSIFSCVAEAPVTCNGDCSTCQPDGSGGYSCAADQTMCSARGDCAACNPTGQAKKFECGEDDSKCDQCATCGPDSTDFNCGFDAEFTDDGVCPDAPDPTKCAGECDGSGGCRSICQNGVACDSSDQCESGFCVDGVCCESGCSGFCESCGLSGQEGSCVVYDLGEDPENACPDQGDCISTCTGDDGSTCTDTCGNLGDECLAGIDCDSGYCVDGLCCNNACDSGCSACNLAGNEGFCTALADDAMDSECPTETGCCLDGACTPCPAGEDAGPQPGTDAGPLGDAGTDSDAGIDSDAGTDGPSSSGCCDVGGGASPLWPTTLALFILAALGRRRRARVRNRR